MDVPDYLVIGHLSKDLRPNGGAVAGGTALYAALTAARLGQHPALVTALAARDCGLLDAAHTAGVSCTVIPSPATTTFANHYEGETRQQIIYTPAALLAADAVP